MRRVRDFAEVKGNGRIVESIARAALDLLEAGDEMRLVLGEAGGLLFVQALVQRRDHVHDSLVQLADVAAPGKGLVTLHQRLAQCLDLGFRTRHLRLLCVGSLRLALLVGAQRLLEPQPLPARYVRVEFLVLKTGHHCLPP
ncbi:hypothetical protein [Cypionkella sinensis]|uniref:RuvB AAA lid domain-containing protein n=1 Tax=Cypionkella sinensis TaxID=1756043 RepID=A0ABV7J941_9RHOB